MRIIQTWSWRQVDAGRPRRSVLGNGLASGQREWIQQRRAGVRTAALGMLALLSASLYLLITLEHIQTPADATAYITIVGLLFVLYAVACLIVLASERPSPARRGAKWVSDSESGSGLERDQYRRIPCLELTMLIGAGLVFIALVFPNWPNLSPDSWRYLWDPQVILHGFNPYQIAPGDPRLSSLRTAYPLIYANMRYRNVPTIYPPGAQGLYLLTALLSDTIYGIKATMTLLSLIAAALVMVLLYRRGQDLRRVIIYLWNPLIVLEFALNAHIDIAAVVWILLAILAASAPWPRHRAEPAACAPDGNGRRVHKATGIPQRALIGFLIGMAVLTKLWPLILVIAFANPLIFRRHPPIPPGLLASHQQREQSPTRRAGLSPAEETVSHVPARRFDWAFYGAMILTILIGYAPFLLHGLGATGFLATYLNQNQPGAGPIVLLIRWAGSPVHLMHQQIFHNTVGHYVELAAAALALLAAVIVRLRARTTPAAMTLVLAAIWLATSPHIFPWYVSIFPPLLALFLEWPFWHRPAAVAALGLWLFTGLVQIAYVGYLPGRSLMVAYAGQYWLPATLLAIAALWWLWQSTGGRRSRTATPVVPDSHVVGIGG